MKGKVSGRIENPCTGVPN